MQKCQEQLRVVNIQNDSESLQELFYSLKIFLYSIGKFNRTFVPTNLRAVLDSQRVI